MHAVGQLVLSHHISCEALPGGAGPGVCLLAPSPHAEVGLAMLGCWQEPSQLLAGWREPWVPVRMGQPQASRDHFRDQGLPALAEVTVKMCPGFLLKTSKCDFFIQNTW